MSKQFYFFQIIFIAIAFSIYGQDLSEKKGSDFSHKDTRDYMRIMFYNTENLFDCVNDSLKNDEQFLPDGDKHWTPRKYNEKLSNICKVVIAVGGWEPPEIIGFCEVENRYVLEDILMKTPLSNLDYEIVHHESPDRRGIDVALFYRKSKFKVIYDEAIRVVFPFDANKPTRDILYVKGETYKGDTLHIYVNHWPSRWGGQMETEPKRMYVASVLKKHTDSLFKLNRNANIIIMGDLNDHIDNISITETLEARHDYDNVKSGKLYNLSNYLEEEKGKGTHKHQGEWGVLDHIIVSGGLLLGSSGAKCSKEDAEIFDADFLLEKDDKHVGYRPFRTYIGFKFHGGFSDHMPIYLDLHKKKNK
jgi:hypothetical protein